MLISSLRPTLRVRAYCEQCGASGTFPVAELQRELGEDRELTFEALRRRFGECCGEPLKVEPALRR